MSSPPVSAYDLVIDAWRQGFRALAAMPMLAVSTLALELGLALAIHWIIGSNTEGSPVTMGFGMPFILGTLRGPLSLLIVSSLLVAVHRFVLLDEVADRAAWRLPTAYFRFVSWLLLLEFVLSFLIIVVTVLAGRIWPPLVVIPGVAGWIALAVLHVRLLILFPAIAIDASTADARNSWEDSSGHFWRILVVTMLTVIPVMIVGLVFFILVLVTKVLPTEGMVIAFNAVLYACFGAMAAALASRFYQLYGRSRMVEEPSYPDAAGSVAE